MKLHLRKARNKDHKVWLALRQKLWPGSAKKHASEIKKLSSNRNFICFIAWNGPAPIGFSEASIRSFANGCDERPVPFLEGLWVNSSVRRMKIGEKLVSAVENWALKRGFREIGSDAHISNKVSHRVHKAYGFKETERVIYFKKSLAK